MKRIYLSSVVVFLTITFILSCASKTTPTSTPSNDVSVVSKPLVSEATILAGHQLFDQNCGKCHRLFAPTEFNKKRWVRIIDEMAPKARLSTEDKSKVLAFVLSDAKK